MNAQPREIKPILKLHRNEAKKVNVENGYTMIPNELLLALGQFPFTQRQYAVVIAVIQKTLSWQKEMDWICNEQLAELAGLSSFKKASETKQQLIEMNVLVQKGKKIGLNLYVSEWKNTASPKTGEIPPKEGKKSPKTGECIPPKLGNTKETITKEINNIPPIIPQGGAGNGSPTAPASSGKTKTMPVDYEGVMQAWNDVFAETPIAKLQVMNEERKRKVHRLAKNLRSQFGDYSPDAFADYFADFWQQVNKPNSFHLGNNNRKWIADFAYVMRPEIFAKTVENAL